MHDEADVASCTALARILVAGGLGAEIGSVGEREQIVGESGVGLLSLLARPRIGGGRH